MNAVAAAKRRVLVVTADFPPSLEVGAHTVWQLIRHLPCHGWEPIVLTTHERYAYSVEGGVHYAFPGRVIRTAMLPHPLELWAAVRRSCSRIAPNEVHGLHEGRTVAVGRLKRWVLSLLKIPDAHTGWLPIAVPAGIAAVCRHRVEHIVSSAPHWTNHLIGLCIALVTRRPWTAHFRDPWMGVSFWKPVSTLSLAIESALEALVVKRATNVVCVTEMHRRMLLERYPRQPPSKFSVVTNGFDEDEWGPPPPGRSRRPAESTRFVIAYVGSVYHGRTPFPVLRALRTLADAGAVDPARVRMDLIGWCDVAEGRHVADVVRELRLQEVVDLVGPVPRRYALARMSAADLLLLIEDTPYQIPAKTYEYLRAGRPILAMAGPGAIGELLRDVPGAVVVDRDDSAGIAKALQAEFARWRDGVDSPSPGPDFVGKFDRRRLAGQLADVLRGDATTERA
jgi:glycosyltransferase involved in cell wall biosynthesis